MYALHQIEFRYKVSTTSRWQGKPSIQFQARLRAARYKKTVNRTGIGYQVGAAAQATGLDILEYELSVQTSDLGPRWSSNT